MARLKDLHLLHLAFNLRSVALNNCHLLAGPDGTVVDPTDPDSADIIIVEDRGDLNLKRLVFVAVRRRNMLQQCLENRLNVGSRLFQMPGCDSRAA